MPTTIEEIIQRLENKAKLKVTLGAFSSWNLDGMGQDYCLPASIVALEQPLLPTPVPRHEGSNQLGSKVLQQCCVPSSIFEGLVYSAVHLVNGLTRKQALIKSPTKGVRLCQYGAKLERIATL